jgi:hypothetical protein
VHTGVEDDDDWIQVRHLILISICVCVNYHIYIYRCYSIDGDREMKHIHHYIYACETHLCALLSLFVLYLGGRSGGPGGDEPTLQQEGGTHTAHR